MSANNRIIDRDIDFYNGEVERCISGLQSCPSGYEPAWSSMLICAMQVSRALESYRAALDNAAEQQIEITRETALD